MEILGFPIQKENTCIIANYHAAMRDPEVFPEPEKFKPSRFLAEDRSLVNEDLVVAWGVGKPQMI